jgi:NAD(P)-dependent dehydrogenase (short-subunit alcohol dehydrogenase family)
MHFQGKVVAVTGGAMGIGEATVIAFASLGASVVIVDIDPDIAQKVASKISSDTGKVLISQTDISDEKQVEDMVNRVVSEWGRLDILVNNAGIYHQGDILGTSLDTWYKIMNVNLTGAFLCSKYAAAAMVHTGGGVIINIASEAALVGIKGQVAYNVSKGGMIQLTRSCAVDLAEFGIRVNCVCPGTTETPLVREAVNRAPDPKAAKRALEEVRPLNRLGQPEEIATATLYMASDEIGYATGAILCVDGGSTAQ